MDASMVICKPSLWTFGIQGGSLKPVLAAMTIRTPQLADPQIPRAALVTVPWRRVLLTEGFGTKQKLSGQCDNANILSTIR